MFLHESAVSVLLLRTSSHILVPNFLRAVRFTAESDFEFRGSVSRTVHVRDLQDSVRPRFRLHTVYVAGTINDDFFMYFIFVCCFKLSIDVFVQVFFERLFVTRPWKALFVTTDDDIENWWFKWKVDRLR